MKRLLLKAQIQTNPSVPLSDKQLEKLLCLKINKVGNTEFTSFTVEEGLNLLNAVADVFGSSRKSIAERFAHGFSMNNDVVLNGAGGQLVARLVSK